MHFSVSYKLLTIGKGATTFQQKWCSLYGLKVTAREASSGRVNTVECKFCRSFSKDDTRSDPKRSRTESIKVFSKPWRSDHKKAHVQEQHSIKYDEYAKLSDEQMKTFFRRVICYGERSMGCVHIGRSHEDTVLTFYIEKPIVVNVLGDLLFDPDDNEDAATRTCPVLARIKHKSELFLAPRNNSRGSPPESPEKSYFGFMGNFPRIFRPGGGTLCNVLELLHILYASRGIQPSEPVAVLECKLLEFFTLSIPHEVSHTE
jgi:hypothetical protein